MMVRAGLGLAVIAALMLAACSMGHGIGRKGAVAAIDTACVETAIRGTQGIEVIDIQDNEMKSWDLGGKKTVIQAHNIIYRQPDGRQAGFSLQRSNQETNVVLQHAWGAPTDEKITPDMAQTAIREMLRVEHEIEKACNVAIVMSTTCARMDCKPVEAIVAEDEA